MSNKGYDESGSEICDAPFTDRATDRIAIVVSEHEHSMIRYAAQRNGETVEQYIRRLILADMSQPKKMVR